MKMLNASIKTQFLAFSRGVKLVYVQKSSCLSEGIYTNIYSLYLTYKQDITKRTLLGLLFL